jgi:hypothetical protein
MKDNFCIDPITNKKLDLSCNLHDISENSEDKIHYRKFCHACGASYFPGIFIGSRMKDPYYNMTEEHYDKCYFCGNELDLNPFTIDDDFDETLVQKRIKKEEKCRHHGAIKLTMKVQNVSYEEACKIHADDQKNVTQQSSQSQTTSTPQCPICGSTKLAKISATRKIGKIALFGVFGMGDNGKTWRCKNCGSKF